VYGHPEPCGVIDFSIGRDPTRKHRMIHQPSSGISRSALTSYKVLAYYDTYSLVEVRIVTGRTHQIRVHFAAIGHPVVGDTVYGKKSLLIDRQALHAKQLSFCYQAKQYVFDASPASDMQRLIEAVTK
jgi:23S rRNA pseudouridine1911/1915/1917 synthase